MATKKEETKELNELAIIQTELKAPKSQYNSFGKYKYRSCSDILEAIKPLLAKTGCILVVSDEIVPVGNRIYVKAVATLVTKDGTSWTATGYAREEDSKKGMDASQVTGAASSYARKYALNGLLAIDDTADADALNTSAEYTQQAAQQTQQTGQNVLQQALIEIAACTTTDALLAVWGKYASLQRDANFTGAMTARKDQIAKNGKK